MKFATAREHRDYFRNNQYVEFEGLLSPAQMQQLDAEIKKDSTRRSQDQLFEKGRDLWRLSPAIRKIITQQRLAQIVTELTNVQSMRLGYDQLFPAVSENMPINEHGIYANFLKHPHELEEISSLQGVICGLIFCLTENSNGTGTFISPKYLIDFPKMMQDSERTYYLVVYAQLNSVYVHCPKDPLGYFFKDLGYNFGDKLTNKNNPILMR